MKRKLFLEMNRNQLKIIDEDFHEINIIILCLLHFKSNVKPENVFINKQMILIFIQVRTNYLGYEVHHSFFLNRSIMKIYFVVVWYWTWDNRPFFSVKLHHIIFAMLWKHIGFIWFARENYRVIPFWWLLLKDNTL